MKKERVYVYELKFTDGLVSIALSSVHRSYLRFLAEKGGESRFDYEIAKLTEDQKAHMKKLVEYRMITETVSIGDRASVVYHRLTDLARNIIPVIIKEDGGSLGEIGRASCRERV